MNLTKSLLIFSSLLLVIGCGRSINGSPDITGLTVSSSLALNGDPNVMSVTIGSGICLNVDQPCVSVTICKPGTTNCETITDVLVDTGSFGLRLFNTNQVQALGLPQVTTSTGTVAECFQFLDNSSDWGPVAMADVILGSEQTTTSVPIQIIDSNFPGRTSSNCPNPATSPSQVKFNGILGVGSSIADCGPGCGNVTNNGFYFNCFGGSCSGLKVIEANQVSNPVAFLPTDNNGVILSLPDISNAGAGHVFGYLILGIGTQPNNTASSALNYFQLDSTGNFTTVFKGQSYSNSFIDSGSNGLYFPSGGTGLTVGSDGFFNNSTIRQFTATQTDGTTSVNIAFQILGSPVTFAAGNPNRAFNDIGAPLSSGFDWGLPFFFGRNVYVGFEGRSSNLGTGPYWAY